MSSMMVLTTVSKKSDANRIIKHLLGEKLIACGSIVPNLLSHYVWKSKLCSEKEYLLLLKTISKNFTRLEKILSKIHPYECPEIIGFQIDKISKSYFKWLRACS